MRKILLNISVLVFLISCSENNDINSIEIDGTFVHQIENCDNSNNPERNCTEFIEFNKSGNVNVLIGGGDMMFSTNYSINNSKVEFEKSLGLNFDISFNIIDDTRLERIEDGEIWTKDN